MKTKIAAFGLFLLCGIMTIPAWAQHYPITTYDEPDDGRVADAAAWAKLEQQLHATWTSKDVLYTKRDVPATPLVQETVVHAWRGERVGVEALLYTPVAIPSIGMRLTSWSKEGKSLSPQGCEARFLNFVLTDEYNKCGNHPTDLPAYLVPDVIDLEGTKMLEACTVRPVWCTLEIPRDIESGVWQTALEVYDAATQQTLRTLRLSIHVKEHTLPLPADQQFNLNMWQQPYAASRYYGVKKWSDEHLAVLRPYMERLARAGQTVVTTILFYEPWGDQSHDKFDPMVETIKRKDGTWAYDYTLFDRYVEFMASCGIYRQINCFSMVPWDMNFRYFDEATGAFAYLKTKTSTEEYRELWTSFLIALADHLREKGWYDKTCIAMDERSLDDMQRAYDIAQAAVPGIKMALAGNYHTELADKLYDYCVALNQFFTADELAARNAKGCVTTAYTCCAEPKPNLFSNSQPVEGTYLPLYCIANGFNGYLHWSWMNWAEEPLLDTRFRLFASGDTYLIYPGNRSSVRFERLIEGIAAYEKICILRNEYMAQGRTDALEALEAAVANCKSPDYASTEELAQKVNRLLTLLNEVK